MKIEQVSVKHHAVEDRLLISLITSEEGQPNTQFNYLMTRSMTKQFIPLLNKYFDQEQLKTSTATTEEAKKEIKKMQHKKMLEDVEFASEGAKTEEEIEKEQEMEVRDFLLLHSVYMKPLESEKILLSLVPEDESKGFQVALNMKFLHSMYQLFVNAIKRADWNLEDKILVDANQPALQSDLEADMSKIDSKKLN